MREIAEFARAGIVPCLDARDVMIAPSADGFPSALIRHKKERDGRGLSSLFIHRFMSSLNQLAERLFHSHFSKPSGFASESTARQTRTDRDA